MSSLLSNVGNPINFAMNPYGFIDTVVAKPGGGYTVLRMSFEDGREYIQNIDANGKVGKPVTVKLGSGFIGDINPEAGGGFTVTTYEGSFSGPSKISLSSLASDGTLKPFYSVSPPEIDDQVFRTAFNDAGGIALARIGGTAAKPTRIVDVFDADHRKTASVVVDSSLAGDQPYSTKVLALSNGNFLVTWAEGNADGANVKAQVVTAAGRLLGSKFTIGHADDLSTPAEVNLRHNTIALANGGFTVAYQGSEFYADPTNPTAGESQRGPLTLTSWSTDASGRLVQGADLIQDSTLSDPKIENLLSLSDGRVLQILTETRTGSDGVLLKTLHGYLYDQSGGAAKDHFEFYTQASTENYFEEDYRVEAGPNGSFALVKSEFESATSYSTHDTFQVYGLGEENYYTVAGATTGDDTLGGRNTRSDLIAGSSGNDTLSGLGSSDKLLGGDGNDRLDGGTGIDRMEGGKGDDTFVVDTLGDKVVEARVVGVDTVLSSVSYTLTDNVENLVLTGSTARLGFGNGLANAITGNAGANVLFGLGGADVIDGGRGADTLHDGSGADRFVFKAIGDSGVTVAKRDTIADFSKTARDKIDLSLIDANTSLTGHQDFDFIGTSAFTKTAGQLRYADTAEGTLLSGDVTGDGKADFSVLLLGKIALAGTDFV